MNETLKTGCGDTMHGHCHKTLSWTAIVVGALVSIGISFLLNLFAVSLGLVVYPTDAAGATTFAVGAFVVMTLIAFITMFAGGFVAGKLGRWYNHVPCHGGTYGFAAWCVGLVLMALVATRISDFTAHYNQMINPTYVATTSMNVTRDDRAPMVDKRATSSRTQEVTVNADKAAMALGTAGFITFFLFFIGALASCFGGYCGMTCWGRDNEVDCTHKH